MPRKTVQSVSEELKVYFTANGYGQDYGEGLTKLAEYLNSVIMEGIEMAREADAELIEELRDRERKSLSEATEYKLAFNRLKGVIDSILNATHWVLRLGTLGCSFWFLGWRFAAGVLSFILADELIRWGRREAEDIKP